MKSLSDKLRVMICCAAALWLLAFPSLTVALNPSKTINQYDYDVWQSEAGLPQNTVQTIAQTTDGYLWLGTQEGLARFDGKQFTVFDKRSSEQIKNNIIQALWATRHGGLWIGGDGGLTYLQNGRFTNYTKRDGLANDMIRALYETSDGVLWIGTDNGLSKFKDGKFTSYTTRDGLSNNQIFALCEDDNGSLWIGTGHGLNKLQNNRVTTYFEQNGIAHNVVRKLTKDRKGNLWIGTYGGLTRFANNKFTSYTTHQGLSNNIVHSIYEDRSGNLWVGTGEGLNRFDGSKFTHRTTENELRTDTVFSLYEDSEGSLWVGTEGNGLVQLKDGKLSTFTTQDGLSHDLVRAVYQDRAGAMWIGTDGGGLNRIENGEVTALTLKDGLSNDKVRAIREDTNGNLWIGTYGGGVNLLKDGKIKRISTKEGLSNDLVRTIYEDRQGSIWVGTYGGGLNRLRDGKIEHFTTREGLSSNMIFYISEDHSGNLWFATRSGLSKFADGKFTNYTTKDGLANDLILTFYQDTEGTFWIGTSGGGLVRFKDGKFATITMQHGLFDDLAYYIREDAHGNLWMSCNKGIYSVSKRELNNVADGISSTVKSASYDKADGMKSSECNGGNQDAATMTRDGKFWFATLKGAVIIDPNNIVINRTPPPVVIESLKVSDWHTPLNGKVELAPGSDNFEIQYTALSFIAPDKVRFKYKLEGFDKDWIDAGTRRTAYYTNVPPGNYRFRVIACNNDGIWNEAGAALDFNLKPYFYQTSWFYLLCVLTLLFLGVGGFRLRVMQMKRRERELVQLVAARTQQLQDTNAALEDQTHQLAEANQQLHRLSYLDGLTGVANRRYFDELVAQEWRRATRNATSIGLIMVDVDYFKLFNDTYGHGRGDECLKQVAKALQDALSRAGDVVARYGGEEFAVILPNANRDGVRAIADKLRASIEALMIPHATSQSSKFVTISLGGATLNPDDETSLSLLFTAADEALYQAKRAGRNRFMLSNKNTSKPVETDLLDDMMCGSTQSSSDHIEESSHLC